MKIDHRIRHAPRHLLIFTALAMIVSLLAAAQEAVHSPDEKLQTAALLAFTESPVYAEDGSVYFVDIVNNRILRLQPGTSGGPFSGGPEVFRYPAGRAAGLVFDLQGRLLATEINGSGGNRRVTRTEKDGTITVLADHYHGKKLNSPNDLDIDAEGRIYFTTRVISTALTSNKTKTRSIESIRMARLLASSTTWNGPTESRFHPTRRRSTSWTTTIPIPRVHEKCMPTN